DCPAPQRRRGFSGRALSAAAGLALVIAPPPADAAAYGTAAKSLPAPHPPAHWQLAQAGASNTNDQLQELIRQAEALKARGDYRGASERWERILAIVEKVLGAEHPDTATSLNTLAELYRAQGRYGEAEPLYKRSLAISEKVLGAEHPLTATSLSNLAGLYEAQGRYGEAEPLHKRSLAIREKVLGAEHPDTATSLSNLAELHLQQGQSAAAGPLLQRLNGSQAQWLRRELPLQPRGLRSSLLEAQPDAIASTFALLDQDPGSAPLALETRLNRQGLLAEIERRQALLKGSSPQARQLAEQVAGLDRLLNSVTLPPDQRDPLRQQRQQLESQLYRLLPALRIAAVRTEQVAAALKAAAPHGLLVEFQRYRPVVRAAGQGEWGQPRYVALLLWPDGRIRAIALGEAAPLDEAVAAAVAASADSRRQLEASERLAAVSRLLLLPLQRELAGVQELFVSPDGELNRLPFAALPLPAGDGSIAADGPTLGDKVALRLLTTGRDLLRLQQPAKASGPALLVANPDFNAMRSTAVAPARTGSAGLRPAAGLWGSAPPSAVPSVAPSAAPDASRAPAASGLHGAALPISGLGSLPAWPALAGTEQEARQLTPLLGGKALISGPAATASAVLAQRSPRILHIATHGFFLADQPAAAGTGGGEGSAVLATATSSRGSGAGSLAANAATTGTAPALVDPLQRSGLVFAGANHPTADPADDGYLTAAEATAMELEGTELVTLSACETGLGGARSGEGVYGLQRALAVAGARSTLLSLWKVDDAATVSFMERYYNRLRAGEGRAEALRHTQAEFRNHTNATYHDIRVWAAFQLSGDWRPINAGRSGGR
ncbi:MAG: CHAT domain-containing protein, partial [Cyanobium sp.]